MHEFQVNFISFHNFLFYVFCAFCLVLYCVGLVFFIDGLGFNAFDVVH